ncbi:hypothetical protein AVEN_138744-1, partial [Araneus ventricosus]
MTLEGRKIPLWKSTYCPTARRKTLKRVASARNSFSTEEQSEIRLPPVLSAPNEPFLHPHKVVEYSVSITTTNGLSGVWGFSQGGKTVNHMHFYLRLIAAPSHVECYGEADQTGRRKREIPKFLPHYTNEAFEVEVSAFLRLKPDVEGDIIFEE